MSRILLVEDSPSQAVEAAYLLEKAGMQVVHAEDGQQALECLAQESFDLVLSDIQMPGMSGYELCRRIRLHPATHTMPVILLTTLTTPSDILRGLECMADNYVTKPYAPDYLIERIHTTIANRQVRSQRGVQVGLQVTLHNEKYNVGPDLEKALDFLLTTVEECVRMKEEVYERRLEEETRRFFTLSLDLLAIVGEDGRFKRLNPAWEATSGYSMAELLVHPWEEFVHPDDRASALASMQSGGAAFETRFRCRDGSSRRLLWSSAMAREEGLHYVAARDITGRANEEDAARLRARLQTAIATLGQQALVETDVSILIRSASQRVCQALDTDVCGFMERQSDGTLLLPSGDGWPGDGAADELAGYTLEQRTSVVVEDHHEDGRFPQPRGGMVSSACVVVPGRDKPFGVLGTHTTRQRSFGSEETLFLEGVATILASAIARNGAEQELRRSEERNRLLLESTAEAIYGIDLHGVCTFCNPATLHLLGYENADQLLGKNMHSLIHYRREDGSDYPQSACPVMRGEAVHVDDEVLWRADGSYFHAEYWSYPVRRGDERVGSVVTFLDITGRRLLEQQFRHAQKMEAVGRLAGGIAHDFNNLLTVVSGYCTLLEKDQCVEGTEGRAMLAEINSAATRATSLTRQLLSFSRRQVTRPRVVDLNVVVADVERLLSRLIGSDVTLRRDAAPGPVTVKADPTQLEQVLVNLIVNARDAMPSGGQITIRTANIRLEEHSPDRPVEARPGAYRLLSVQDTGMGMPPEVQARIFEPFFTTKDENKGTGLGLSTVYGILTASQAYIRVVTEVGRGTTFVMYFHPAEGAETSLPRVGWLSPISRGAETVLVVEDDRELRKLAGTLLERNGYRVLLAEDGATAMSMGHSYTDVIHLMVTDLNLPDLSGRELMDKMAQFRPDTRLLVTSGYGDPDMDGEPLAGHFLPKPYTPDLLLRAVRQVLDGKAAAQDVDVA